MNIFQNVSDRQKWQLRAVGIFIFWAMKKVGEIAVVTFAIFGLMAYMAMSIGEPINAIWIDNAKVLAFGFVMVVEGLCMTIWPHRSIAARVMDTWGRK